MPEFDMYMHLLNWFEFYEELLGRPLQPDDYVFPTLGANGTSVQPNRPMSSDVAQKRIVQMAKQAGISGAEYFTTHCFRRGGAQWRFMFAPLGQRWILEQIHWWGGWAIGEHVCNILVWNFVDTHQNVILARHIDKISSWWTLYIWTGSQWCSEPR